MNSPGEIGLRLGIVGAALGLWFWSQRLLARRPATAGVVGDRIHDGTAPLHRRLAANPAAADRTLIVSSAIVDLLGLYLIAAAVLGPTLRPLLAVLSLFALRQACQAACALPTPPGMIWRDPGFPTLFVTYATGNDFFFSGHTGIAVLGALELARTGSPWLAGIAAAIALAEAAAVLVLRAHWTVDVVAAVFAALCCHRFAGWCAPAVDAWLRGG